MDQERFLRRRGGKQSGHVAGCLAQNNQAPSALPNRGRFHPGHHQEQETMTSERKIKELTHFVKRVTSQGLAHQVQRSVPTLTRSEHHFRDRDDKDGRAWAPRAAESGWGESLSQGPTPSRESSFHSVVNLPITQQYLLHRNGFGIKIIGITFAAARRITG